MHKLVKSVVTLVHHIPVLHVALHEQFQEPLPTVFLYHGFASQKENYSLIAEIFSLYGFRVIVPDAPLHGQRIAERHLQDDFWPIIVQSVEEFPILFQYVADSYGVSPSKSAVYGSSMGGFIATGIFGQHPDLSALVSVNGSGAWTVSEGQFRSMQGRPPATEEELHSLQLFDPVNRVAHGLKSSVLLLHGDADTTIPIEGQRVFYERLCELGWPTDNVAFQAFSGVNHQVTTGMFEVALRWLCDHMIHSE